MSDEAVRSFSPHKGWFEGKVADGHISSSHLPPTPSSSSHFRSPLPVLSVLKLVGLHTHAHTNARTHAAGWEKTHKSYAAINDRGIASWIIKIEGSERACVCRCVSGAGVGMKTLEDTFTFSFPFWSHLSVCVSFLLAFFFSNFAFSNVAALHSCSFPCVLQSEQELWPPCNVLFLFLS